jgi:hypothetical protein
VIQKDFFLFGKVDIGSTIIMAKRTWSDSNPAGTASADATAVSVELLGWKK